MASTSPPLGFLDDWSLDMDYIDSAMTFTPSERCTVSCGTVCIDPRTSKVLIIFNRRLGIWQLPKGRKNIGEDLQSAALRETYEETGVHAKLMPLKVCTRSTTPIIVRCPANDPQRRHDSASHRATLSTESMSSMSTACSTSIPSTTSSNFVPPCTVTLPKEVDLPGSLLHGEHRLTTTRKGQETHNADSEHVEATMLAVPATTIDPKLICDVFNNELIGIVQYPDVQAATPRTVKIVFFFAASADSTAPMGPGAQEDHEDLLAEWVSFQVAGDRLRFGSEKEAIWKVRQDMERSGR